MASLPSLLLVICVSLCCVFGKQLDDQIILGRMYSDIIRWWAGSRVNFSIQLTLPISFFQPNIPDKENSRSFHNSNNQPPFFHKRKSSLLTCPSQTADLEDYLILLNITEDICQERFICDLAADPSKYVPLSQILLPKLNYNIAELSRRESYEDILNTTTYYLLRAVTIAKDPNKQCHIEYRGCPKRAEDMINMWHIWGWKLLSHFLNIKYLVETTM